MRDRIKRTLIWTAIAWPITVVLMYLGSQVTGWNTAGIPTFAVIALPTLFAAKMAVDIFDRRYNR
ncbi:hypothetical protein [Pelagibius sp.]|uniref:hypothetical protein n=1 Tax=Pelagibius sp. TaxID=1931238 RepID=UPI003B50BE80